MIQLILIKQCSNCAEELHPLSDFHKDAKKKDGRQTWCKACRGIFQLPAGQRAVIQKTMIEKQNKQAIRAPHSAFIQQFLTGGAS